MYWEEVASRLLIRYVNQFILVDEDEDQQPSFQSYSETYILFKYMTIRNS